MLQLPALTHGTRDLLGKHKAAGKRIDELRDTVAAGAGVDLPQLVELHRVSSTNLMMAIGTLIAAGVLLSQVGSPQELWDTVKNADWWLVVLAVVLSLATNIPYAIALMGCVPIRLPLWPTTETQVAMSFGNLAIPAIGGIAIQIRFLQKRGLDLASAVAAGGLLSTVGNVACQILLFFLALLLSPQQVDIGPVDTASAIEVVLIGIVVVFVAIAVIWGVPRSAEGDRAPGEERGGDGVGGRAQSPSARAAVRRQLRGVHRLRVRAVRVHRGLRGQRELLGDARGEHRRVDDRVARTGAGRQHRGRNDRHVGRAGGARGLGRGGGLGDPHPAARGQLHPCGARLVGVERPAQAG